MIRGIHTSVQSALEGVLFDGMTIMVGGFGICGIPEKLILAVKDSGVKDLTVISNNCGIDNYGLGIWLRAGQIKKMIASYAGANKFFEEKLVNKEIEFEIMPQGTMAERIRAAGAGIPAFYTRTGVGTVVAEGKETREFDGNTYLLERALHADLALIKGHQGDHYRNVVYNKTARNFNQVMATAAKTVICEVEEIVSFLDPDQVHTPGVFVHRMFRGEIYEKRIELRTIRQR